MDRRDQNNGMKKTIKQRVKEKLLQDGYVDNFWALETHLTSRFAATILTLKDEGFEFDEARSGFLEGTKNFRYYLASAPKAPEKPRYVYEFDPERGVMVERLVGSQQTI